MRIVWVVDHSINDIRLADADTAGQLFLWAPRVEIDLVIAKTYTRHFSKVAN